MRTKVRYLESQFNPTHWRVYLTDIICQKSNLVYLASDKRIEIVSA